MKYVLKKQKNVLGTYVLYDINRNPVKCFPKDTGDTYVFETDLEPAVFFTQFMVEGFGGTMIFADNEGKGYTPSETPLDMRRECIKSRLYSVEQYAEKAEKTWGYIPKKVEKRLEKIRRFLGEGTEEAEDKAFAQLLWAGEEIVLFHAEHTIEKRGKRDNFTFGCCMKGFTDGGEPFRDNFKALFGQGTIPTHWGVFEPYRGEKHYDIMFDMLDFAAENGIDVRGHAIVWFCPWW